MGESTKEKRAKLFKGANDEDMFALIVNRIKPNKDITEFKSFFVTEEECINRIEILHSLESKNRCRYCEFKIYDRDFNQIMPLV